MKIDVQIVTYNEGGGHPVISYLGDYLLLNAPASFGSAIETVEIYAHFQSKGCPQSTLESMADTFRSRLQTLPLLWFKRKRHLIEIAYFCKFAYAEDVFEPKSERLSLSLFHEGCREIVAALSLIQERLKRSDDFDFGAFDSYLQRRLEELPTSVSALKKLLDEIWAMEQQRLAANAACLPNIGQPIPKGGPKIVALDHDEYAAKYVGRTNDGRQFFLTTPFVPGAGLGGDPGREFLALYVFDKAGALMSAMIDDFGPRSKMIEVDRVARRDELLASLGAVEYRRITVAPFKVERFGVEFGFIPQPPEDPGEDWSVLVEPGDYMCFWPPWTSGNYDT